MADITKLDNNLFGDIRQLIEAAKQQVAVTVNSSMTMMYWHIGDRINREMLGGGRAEYGKHVVANLSRQLTDEYGGREFSEKNLNRMRLFASRFPDSSIWTPLMSKLSWSHFLQVISLDDDLQRNFYLTMAADQRWSTRTLKAKIDGMLFERTAIAKQPETVILHDLKNYATNEKCRPTWFSKTLMSLIFSVCMAITLRMILRMQSSPNCNGSLPNSETTSLPSHGKRGLLLTAKITI